MYYLSFYATKSIQTVGYNGWNFPNGIIYGNHEECTNSILSENTSGGFGVYFVGYKKVSSIWYLRTKEKMKKKKKKKRMKKEKGEVE